MPEKIAVVFGAGASYDVDTGSTPETNPEWQPPLVRDLFSPRFYGLRAIYPGADFLAQSLHPLAVAGAINVEERLRLLADSHDPTTRRNYLQIPPYLRDVMAAVGTLRRYGTSRAQPGYVIRPGAYSALIQTLLVDRHQQSEDPSAAGSTTSVCFVNLNYDTMLEAALTGYDPAVYSFDSLAEYTSLDRQAIVLKPHGSVNWWLPILGDRQPSWSAAVAQDGMLDRLRDSIQLADADRNYHAEIVSAHGARVIDDHRISRWVYPRITAPLAGKGAHDLLCPSYQLEVSKPVLRATRRIVFIGTSGWDSDVLGFVAQHLPSEAVARFVFGNGDRRPSIQARNRIVEAIPALRNGICRDEQDVPTDTYFGGFSNYVSKPLLLRFATEPWNEAVEATSPNKPAGYVSLSS